jgi:hypothetical protein
MFARNRAGRAAAVVGLLAPLVFLAQAVTLPSAAQARCAGVGVAVTSTLMFGSTLEVSETPASGTCNNNGTYQGSFRSHNPTGARASVWIQNGGVWTGYLGNYDLNTYTYSFFDANSHSLMNICLDNGTTTWCGWGSNVAVGGVPNYVHTYTGVVSGF